MASFWPTFETFGQLLIPISTHTGHVQSFLDPKMKRILTVGART